MAIRTWTKITVAFACSGVVLAALPGSHVSGVAKGGETEPAALAMDVFKSPTCACCSAWVEHIAKSGFKPTTKSIPPGHLQGLKDQVKLKPEQRSCHTALIGGYVIEGHVPADDVKRLLAEKPDAIGLAVPGMPVGSPGMEGDTKEAYDVLLIKHDGTTTVFASH